MKKMTELLFGTFAGIALAVSSTAYAHSTDAVKTTGAPTLSVNAFVETKGVYQKNKDAFGDSYTSTYTTYEDTGSVSSANYTKFNKRFAGVVDSTLTIGLAGETDGGMLYGGKIALAVSDKSDLGNTAVFEEMNLYFADGSFGKVVLGTGKGVIEHMMVKPTLVSSSGTDYANDDLNYYSRAAVETIYGSTTMSDSTSKYFKAKYITALHMPSDLMSDARRANKISLYFPDWCEKMKFGVSFTPDSQDRGTHDFLTSKYADSSVGEYKTGYARNVVSGALNWTESMNDMTLSTSLLGEFGKAKDIKDAASHNLHRDIKAFGLGAAFGYNQMTLSGTYLHHGKSLNIKTTSSSSASQIAMYNKHDYVAQIGLAVENGPYRADISGLQSEKHGNKFTYYAVSGAWQLQPKSGVEIFAEAGSFEFNSNATYTYSDYYTSDSTSNDARIKNRGEVVILGARANF